LLDGSLGVLLIEIGVKVAFLNCFHDEIDVEMDGRNLIWLWGGKEGAPLLIFEFWMVD
jgi:hypothetical protein